MDLTTGRDFSRRDHQLQAEKRLDQQKPFVLIGSPPCTAFSQLQSLSPASENKEKALKDGVEHMRFVVRLYQKQVRAGRVFVHENLAQAKSWLLPEIRRMMRKSGVDVFEADQCMYGLKTWGKSRSQPVLAEKPIKILTNSRAIGRELSRRCDGTHEHQPLIDRWGQGSRAIPSGAL